MPDRTAIARHGAQPKLRRRRPRVFMVCSLPAGPGTRRTFLDGRWRASARICWGATDYSSRHEMSGRHRRVVQEESCRTLSSFTGSCARRRSGSTAHSSMRRQGQVAAAKRLHRQGPSHGRPVGGTYKMSFTNFTPARAIPSAASTSNWCRTNASAGPMVRRSEPAGRDDGDRTLKKVSVGTELNIVQEGIPDVIPAEACIWDDTLHSPRTPCRGGDPGLRKEGQPAGGVKEQNEALLHAAARSAE